MNFPIPENTEVDYQNLIRRGYIIIRTRCVPYRIEVKKKNNRGWHRAEVFDTHDKMIDRFLEMLDVPKTLQDV
jgi:hypothetical protein